jgi:NitT/TauT family transport system ATP-binding protein
MSYSMSANATAQSSVALAHRSIASRSVGAQVLLKEVVKDYPSVDGAVRRAVGPVSLDISPGRFVAVVGPSGCGKTTMLKLLAGMITATSGSIVIDGLSAQETTRTGMVFQAASLFPWRSLAENVAFGMELQANASQPKLTKAEMQQRARELLALVGLKGVERYYPHQVSGGMQQRVNLARALAVHPTLLLMDEPFSALDAQTREELQVELQRIAAQAAPTTVFVTHDIREAVFLGDEVVVLSSHPGTVAACINVSTPRPRPLGFQVSTEFVESTREIWRLVHPGSRGE